MSRNIQQSISSYVWVIILIIIRHTYCKQCIVNWLNKNNTCPICRIKFELNQSGKDLIAFNIINDLSVLCNNRGNSYTYFTFLLKDAHGEGY